MEPILFWTAVISLAAAAVQLLATGLPFLKKADFSIS